MVKTTRKVDFLNYNEIIIFIGGIIMALSLLALTFVDDEDFFRVGWGVFCVGVCILSIGALLNFI